jgi:ribosomal protein S18 acetylase RimI-like enzyme
MLGHVERRALDRGSRTLILQVNKRNEKAIKLYRRSGFAIREEVVVDIGGGFVMDDYVMAKRLRHAPL